MHDFDVNSIVWNVVYFFFVSLNWLSQYSEIWYLFSTIFDKEFYNLLSRPWIVISVPFHSVSSLLLSRHSIFDFYSPFQSIFISSKSHFPFDADQLSFAFNWIISTAKSAFSHSLCLRLTFSPYGNMMVTMYSYQSNQQQQLSINFGEKLYAIQSEYFIFMQTSMMFNIDNSCQCSLPMWYMCMDGCSLIQTFNLSCSKLNFKYYWLLCSPHRQIVVYSSWECVQFSIPKLNEYRILNNTNAETKMLVQLLNNFRINS